MLQASKSLIIVVFGSALVAVSVARATVLTTSAAAAAEQVTRISLAGLGIDGAPENVRGRILVGTPVPAFKRTNRDASPSARFSVTVSGRCQAEVAITKRALATRVGPVTQTRQSTRFGDLVLGSDTRRDGAWRLVEFRRVDPDTLEKTDEKQLYGLAVIRLAPRRWMHVRALADFRGSCSEKDRRKGVVSEAFQHLLRTARVEARIVRRVR